MTRRFDIAIVGGGINGCGIARDAAGRGLSVVLVEMGDIAGKTSSASTKLIHGGLRYLERFEFRLVREALAEREILWRMAPHLIRPMRFVLPHQRGMRPLWMIGAGLFLYDHLARRNILPGFRFARLAKQPAGVPLAEKYRFGFEYSDCTVDDARLAVANAVDAAERGAVIAVRCTATNFERRDESWRLSIDRESGGREEIEARCLVNATGPWAADLHRRATGTSGAKLRLVKGSHIVVPRLFGHDRSYVFQHPDGRVIFAIPYEDEFTLIGTTDRDFSGDPSTVAIDDDEKTYLCAAASAYFRAPISPEEIVWSYSGVRPLLDDGVEEARQASRDYTFALDRSAAPVLTIVGGKITTYRRLAEAALDRLKPFLAQAGRPWTAGSALPGGEFPVDGLDALTAQISKRLVGLPDGVCRRLARTYGTRAFTLLAGARHIDDLGTHFGAGLYEAEVRHLVRNEWACSADDILERRTKLCLRFSTEERRRLESFVARLVREPRTEAA